MKSFYTILVLLLLFVFTNNSYAQNPNAGFTGNLGGGISIPTGDLADGWLLGFNCFGSGGYIFHKNFGTRLDLQYNIFPFDNKNVSGISGGTFGILSVKADFLAGDFTIGSKIIPYGIFGIGFYIRSISDITISGLGTVKGDSETDFGIGVGGGVGFKFAKNMAFFGEAQFNNIFSEGSSTTYIPFKVGIMYIPW